MNELIAFIIIWAIISFLSQLSKKAKQKSQKPEAKKARPSPQRRQEIPTILQDLLGLPEEKETTKSLPLREDEKEYGEALESSEEEIFVRPEESETKLADQGVEEIPVIPELKVETKEDKKAYKEPYEIKEVKYPKRRLYDTPQSIRQAIIWKEILDKPLSLRGRNLFQNPFSKV